MSVTRNDVARAAGVSVATVSYVVNNGPRSVSPETHAKVLKAIAALGYRPNALARNLRRQQTTTIAVLVPETRNPAFLEVAIGVESAAFQKDFTVILCHSDNYVERELRYVEMLGRERVAGAVWVPVAGNPEPLRRLREYEIPTVVVDRLLPETENAITVVSDNFRGGYLVTEHLIQLGHRRVAFIDSPITTSPIAERQRGYRSALLDHGFPVDEALIVKSEGFRIEDGLNVTLELLSLESPPTAVFCYSDMMAFGVMRAANEAGLSVPNELSVVGFDDIPQAAYFFPPLTTVANPIFDLGRRAAELVLDLISGKTVAQRTVLPIEVVIRQSTGPVFKPSHQIMGGCCPYPPLHPA